MKRKTIDRDTAAAPPSTELAAEARAIALLMSSAISQPEAASYARMSRRNGEDETRYSTRPLHLKDGAHAGADSEPPTKKAASTYQISPYQAEGRRVIQGMRAAEQITAGESLLVFESDAPARVRSDIESIVSDTTEQKQIDHARVLAGIQQQKRETAALILGRDAATATANEEELPAPLPFDDPPPALDNLTAFLPGTRVLELERMAAYSELDVELLPEIRAWAGAWTRARGVEDLLRENRALETAMSPFALAQNIGTLFQDMEDTHGLVPEHVHLWRASRRDRDQHTLAWLQARVGAALAPIDPADYAVHGVACDFVVDEAGVFALRIMFAAIEDTTQTSSRSADSRVPVAVVGPGVWARLSTPGHVLESVWKPTKAPVGESHEMRYPEFAYVTRLHREAFNALRLHAVAAYFVAAPPAVRDEKTHAAVRNELTVDLSQ